MPSVDGNWCALTGHDGCPRPHFVKGQYLRYIFTSIRCSCTWKEHAK